MSPKRYPKRRTRERARERIDILWEHALKYVDTRPDLAMRWMEIARRIAQRARIKLPKDMSRRLCKRCRSLLIPGRTCRTRVRTNRSTHLTVTCLECGTIWRFPIIRQS